MATIWEMLMVITAFMLVTATAFGIVAPSLGIAVPEAPVFPSLPDIGGQGNQSATYPFSETHELVAGDGNTYVLYPSLTPDKRVGYEIYGTTIFSSGVFVVQRFGTIFLIPYWYNEPIFYLNKTQISRFTPQLVVDNFDGSYATFVVDSNNTGYQALVRFSPLSGYADMVSSWNVGHGFTVWLAAHEYTPPDWTEQVVADLTFLASILGYFVYFLAYLVSMASVLFSVIGLVPALASGIVVLITIAFVGSLLMFIRGIGGGGSNK